MQMGGGCIVERLQYIFEEAKAKICYGVTGLVLVL